MSERDITAQDARNLLDEAGRLRSAARAGAGWPNIALLLGLGGVSSMFVIGMALAARLGDSYVVVPMIVMLVWVGILSTVMLVFTRKTKLGFGRRWRRALSAWGLTWVAAIIGGAVWWRGELGFAIAAALALTLVTVIPAWIEARR